MNNSSLNLRTLFSFPDPAATAAPSNQWQEFQNRLRREVKTIKWPAAMPDLASKIAELFNVELPDLLVSSWKKARELQPWLLTADRTVGGLYENYITPEQQIPGETMNVPWESNLTIGTSFSYAFGDEYKSARTLLHLLLEVVSKGGNLALNIGAQPDGRLPRRAMEPALEMGAWLRENGEAVYGTRPCEPYLAGSWAFTRKKAARYAIYRCPVERRCPISLTFPSCGRPHP
jgi:alpha-L-fucosidase